MSKLPTILSKLDSFDPIHKQAWQQYDMLTVMLIWRLYKGGIWDSKDIRDISGLNIHGRTIASLVAGAERALNGQLPLAKPVRCIHCGGKIRAIPCPLCQESVVNAGRVRAIHASPA